MSFLSLTCPPTRASGTPAWNCCWWTQTQATHAAPTPSWGAWCWARLRPALLASTGGRSVTTRAARSPSGTPCRRIRTPRFWSRYPIRSIYERDGMRMCRICLASQYPLDFQRGRVGNKGEGTLMLWRGSFDVMSSFNRSFSCLSLKLFGFTGEGGAWQREPNSFKRSQRLSPKITW